MLGLQLAGARLTIDISSDISIAMLTSTRRVEIRKSAGQTQQEMAQLFGVGIATIARWESPTGTRPSGLELQLYEIMDLLDCGRIPMTHLGGLLRSSGNVAAVRWLFNAPAGAGLQRGK